MTKDKVCGMNVDESKVQFKSDHMGATYYFCSAQCKKTFEADPHKYAQQMHGMH